MSRVVLGDVAIEHKESCKVNRGMYPTVGLEHMRSEEITLTKWDNGGDSSFTKMFRKGNVLFGRRRAYLKKAVIAPFDGICSGDIIVIEAIPNRILPELLPLVIQNDALFDYAVSKSAGSLSPRVKWEHLKDYEFELPDLDRQRKLAEVLWAINDAVESYKKLLDATDKLVKARFGEMFGDLENSQYRCTVHEAVRKGIIEKPLDGNHGEKHPKASEYVSVGIPFIMANDIDRNGNVAFERCNYITKERALKLDKGFAKDGDVLITHKGTIGRTAILHTEKEFVMLTPQVTYYRCVKDILAEYLKGFFDSTYFQSVMQNIAGIGTTRAYIGITAQEKLPLVIPPMELQEQFAAFVHQTDKSKSELEQALSELTATYKRILSENLG